MISVYPCTYRELGGHGTNGTIVTGISLYLQGTHQIHLQEELVSRYIPVPTGNSFRETSQIFITTVYPCTYRELCANAFKRWNISGISLYLQGTLATVTVPCSSVRYIPVPTGNSHVKNWYAELTTVYPCTYRELRASKYTPFFVSGISLYLQGTL